MNSNSKLYEKMIRESLESILEEKELKSNDYISLYEIVKQR